MELSDTQIERYARHLIMPEIDDAGQERLLSSRVLVVGAGGIGAPALIYLAAAGVGQIRLVDDDQVELSNLQRQIIHDTALIGAPKVASAQSRLASVNPEATVEPIHNRLTEENAKDLFKDVDLVLDGSDSYATRCLVNAQANQHQVPLISASVARFDGQLLASRGWQSDQPCYQCLFPEAPANPQSCAEVGVFAPLAGIMGCLAAGEVIKALVGLPLKWGQLLLVDGKSLRFQPLMGSKRQDCPVCSRVC